MNSRYDGCSQWPFYTDELKHDCLLLPRMLSKAISENCFCNSSYGKSIMLVIIMTLHCYQKPNIIILTLIYSKQLSCVWGKYIFVCNVCQNNNVFTVHVKFSTYIKYTQTLFGEFVFLFSFGSSTCMNSFPYGYCHKKIRILSDFIKGTNNCDLTVDRFDRIYSELVNYLQDFFLFVRIII